MKINELEKQVAEQVIDLMKTKGLRWAASWQRDQPACNGVDGHVYRGSNVLTTWIWLAMNDQSDPRFIPRSYLFNKDREQNVGKLRKGSKGIPIVFYKNVVNEDSDKNYRFARVTYVWHVSQIDELDESKLKPLQAPPVPLTGAERDIAIDYWVEQTGAKIKHHGDKAFYSLPPNDFINMPELKRFFDANGYYGTLLHELTHWTGAEHRLDRLKRSRFGSEDYAFEELVAEFGSVLLCTQHGLQAGPREDNAAYLKGWISRLQDDHRLIFDAMKHASQAQQMLNDLQPDEDQEAA